MASYSDYLKYLRNADCACKYAKGDTGPQGPSGPPGVSAQGPNNSVQFKDGATSDLSGSANFTYDSAGNRVFLTATLDLTGNIEQAGNIETQGTVDISGATTIANTLDVSSNATFRSAILMPNSIKIGDSDTGVTNQGTNAVAIGNNAGNSNQGNNSIAIGNNAGVTDQSDNTIVINATGGALNGDTNANACYIDPIRDCSSDLAKNGTFTLKYNTVGKEVTYDTTPMKSLLFFNDPENTFTDETITLDVSLNDTNENGSIAFYDPVSETFGFSDISNNVNLFLEMTFSCDASGITTGAHSLLADISGMNNSDILIIDTRSINRDTSATQTFGPIIFKFGAGSKSIDYSNTYRFRLTAEDTYEVSNCKLYLNAFRLNS